MRDDSSVYSMPSCMYSTVPRPNAVTPQNANNVDAMTVSDHPTSQDSWYQLQYSSPARRGMTPSYHNSGSGSKKVKRSTYKHVPHREKPPHLVQRRNARERRRVQAVNNAFVRLRRHIPHEGKNKRLSKVKTLRIAIDYINNMQQMIRDHDAGISPGYTDTVTSHRSVRTSDVRGGSGRRSQVARSRAVPDYELHGHEDYSKKNTRMWLNNMNFRADIPTMANRQHFFENKY